MRDDELSTILNKTRDYFGFIKTSLSKSSIVLKAEDTEALENVDAYLKALGNGFDNWSKLKTSEHKTILSKCFKCLQRLDRIAKDYKLFQNGSSHS
jgi:hypothetical protein